MKKNWEILNFEECLDKVKNTPKIPQKKFLSEGKFPIISQKENFINGYWNNQNDVLEVTKPVVIFGDHTKIVKFIDFNIGTSPLWSKSAHRYINYSSVLIFLFVCV